MGLSAPLVSEQWDQENKAPTSAADSSVLINRASVGLVGSESSAFNTPSGGVAVHLAAALLGLLAIEWALGQSANRKTTAPVPQQVCEASTCHHKLS